MYKRYHATIVIGLALTFTGCSTINRLPDAAPLARPNITTSTNKTPTPEGFPLSYIKKIDFKNGLYTLTVSTTQMYSGDDALTVALQESGCSKEHIFDGNCAASLDNDFYISTNAKTEILPAAASIQIFIAGPDNVKPTKKITLQQFKNLLEQTDAFSSSVPFRLTISNGTITKMVQQYLP